MGKNVMYVVKNILDRNGCNYQIEKKRGEITFGLDSEYNSLFEECSLYFFVTVKRHSI